MSVSRKALEQAARVAAIAWTLIATAGALVALPATARAAEPPLATQIADVPVDVSAAEFRRDLFVAGDYVRLSQPGATQELVLERVLQRLYAANPGLSAADAAGAIGALRTAAAARMPSASTLNATGGDGRVLGVLAALHASEPSGATESALAQLARVALTETANAGLHSSDGRFAAAGGSLDTLTTTGSFDPAAVLGRTVALADENQRFAAARDALWQSASGESVTWSANRLLAEATTLKDNAAVQALAALRDANGELSVKAGQIAGDATAPAEHTVGAVLDHMGAEQQGAFTDARRLANGQLTSAAAAAQAAARADRMAGWQTAAVLQTRSLKGENADLMKYGKAAGVAGKVVTDLVGAFGRYSKGDIGKVALSGNIAGAALSLLPVALDLFGISSGPDPNEVILEQLQALSQQVADFQVQVNDRIDRAIDGLFTGIAALSDKLDELSADIDQVNARITETYDQIANLQSSVDRLQANIYDALKNMQEGELRRQIAAVIGYEARNDAPLPTVEFNKAATTLHTFAAADAMQAPQVADNPANWATVDPFTQLSTGLAFNVNYLDHLPRLRGWRDKTLAGSSTATIQLANPEDWAMASRAYLQLLLENPGSVTASYVADLGEASTEGLTAIGKRLRAAIQGVADQDAVSGSHSNLFNGLLCDYRAGVGGAVATAGCGTSTGGVLGKLAQLEDDFVLAQPGRHGTVVTPNRPMRNAAGDPVSLFAVYPQEQSSDWGTLIDDGKIPAASVCAGGSNPMGIAPPPGSLLDRLVLPQYKHADRLGLGQLTPCFTTYNGGGASVATIEVWFLPTDPEYTLGAYRVGYAQDGAFTDWGHFAGEPFYSGEQCDNHSGGPDYWCRKQTMYWQVYDRYNELAVQFMQSLLTGDGQHLADTSLRTGLDGLTGTARLISAYANLGLRAAIGHDDVISRLINGSAPLYAGEARFVADVQNAIAARRNNAPISDAIAVAAGDGVSSLVTRIRTAVDAQADESNALVSSTLDALSLARLAATRALPVSIAAPAPGTTVTVARPTFSGASTKDPENSVATKVTVDVYSGLDTGATRVQTLVVQPANRVWSAAAAADLPNGTYTAVARQEGRGNTGASEATTFTVAVPAVPDGGAGGGAGGTPPPSGGGPTTRGDTPAFNGAALTALLRKPGAKTALAYLRGKKSLKLSGAIAGGLKLTVTVKRGGKQVVVAAGRAVAGKTLKLKLTKTGRTLLKRPGTLTLRWTATFTPAAGGEPVSAARTLKVRVPRR
jgi:uncharacterized protein YoxC